MVEILSEGLFLFSCKYSSVPNRRLFLLVNFIYSEKATKFCEISTNYLTGNRQEPDLVPVTKKPKLADCRIPY